MNRVFLAGLVWLFATATASASERLNLSYELWKGGFLALDLKAGLTQGSETYSVDFSVRTRGLVGWIYPYLLEGEADGKLGGAGPQPARYSSMSRWGDDEWRRAISYLGDGTSRTWSDPPHTAEEAEETVPAKMRRDTLDPASAILAVIDAFARVGRCDGDYPVYDGRRRYDLSVNLVGPSTLAPSRYNTYSGPATLCNVTVRKLSGFHDKKRQAGMPDTVKVWLAPVAGAKPAVPVRLEGRNGFGRLVIHLVDAKLESEPSESAQPSSTVR